MTNSTLPTPAMPWGSPPHLENLFLPSHRAKLISEKHGVKIFSEHDQGNGHIRFPVVPGKRRTVTVVVRNHGAEAVTLRRCRPRKPSRELSFTDEQGVTQGQSLLLHPGRVHPLRPALCHSGPSTHLLAAQAAHTPSRCSAWPPAMGTSMSWWTLSSPRSRMGPSASGAASLLLPRASWARTWGPQHRSSLTRPASSTLSLLSPRMASPPMGMWWGHLLPTLLSIWDKAQLPGTRLSSTLGQCFIPVWWPVVVGLGTPCLVGTWVAASWGHPSSAVPVTLLSSPPSFLKTKLEMEIPLLTYQYPKSLKDTILLGPSTSAGSSWAAMQ